MARTVSVPVDIDDFLEELSAEDIVEHFNEANDLSSLLEAIPVEAMEDYLKSLKEE